MRRVLYISYDGVLEPLGQSQILSYLDGLAADHAITLLTFEKPADLSDRVAVAALESRLAARGITWVRLRYHKRPPVFSTAFDTAVGILHARRVCRQRHVAIVHARGYVPSLIALAARGRSRAAFLFDMRGFWVDEKIDAGHWRRHGILHRVGKWCERWFFRSADGIVSLTAAGVRAFPDLGYNPAAAKPVPIVVIPTCVALDRFTPGEKDRQLEASLGLAGARVIGCVGTMSNWYLRQEMLRYLARASESIGNMRILIVTREDQDVLRRDARVCGVPMDRLVVTRAAFVDMPHMMRLFDVGVFFIQPSYSKQGSAATKLAEFLAAGVPVVINDGVGDSGEIVRRGRVGLVLSSLDEAAIARSMPELEMLLADPQIGSRCRQVAVERFDLNQGIEQYRDLYRRLAGGRDEALSASAGGG